MDPELALKMFDWTNSLDKELVSIVLPTFNRPKFLDKCLKSISSQINPPKFEVIVVDDGSDEDNSKKNDMVCEHYAVSHGFDITQIKLPVNSGTVSIPRNIGISYISGRTIAPTDDDCWYTPNKLNGLFETMMDLYMLWTPLVYGNRIEATYDGKEIINANYVNSKRQDPYSVGLDNGQFIYDARIYCHIKPCLAINACDWELYKQIAELGAFVHVDEPVGQYLWHTGNASKVPKHKRVNPMDVIYKFERCFKEGPIKEAIFSE